MVKQRRGQGEIRTEGGKIKERTRGDKDGRG